MAVKTKKKQVADASTQRHLPFSQIRENVMIMKDGSARVVMRCSTVNFLLKSSEEQDSIIISFQRFLNAIDFPVQIMVRSTKLDIDGYLWNLKEKAIAQKNSLLQNQTYEYIEYLKKLVEVAQIMRKEFYIVVPFDSKEDTSVKDDSILGPFKSFWASINSGNDVLKVRAQIKDFSNIKKGLVWRTNSVKTSLENIWIRATELNKKELIKLATDYYNPSLENYASLNMEKNDYNIM